MSKPLSYTDFSKRKVREQRIKEELFVPNIPIEVFSNHNPQKNLHMPIEHILYDDGIEYIQAEVRAIDVETSRVEQARIVALQIAEDLGKVSAEQANETFRPAVICMGDMGRDKAFYIHSDVWYGGKTSIMKMGHMIYALKLTELFAEHLL
ncbi:MAG: hypothetical protein M0Z55_05000 [Peptococcaceae bacterium]|nr:hypothetical protein [Peptococcaceae bacterium]